jgi:hypothetical protein
MAPIQRRRFIDTSDSEITLGIEEQEGQNLELTDESSAEENDQESPLQDETTTRERVVIRPRIKKKIEKQDSDNQSVKTVKKVIKHNSIAKKTLILLFNLSFVTAVSSYIQAQNIMPIISQSHYTSFIILFSILYNDNILC